MDRRRAVLPMCDARRPRMHQGDPGDTSRCEAIWPRWSENCSVHRRKGVTMGFDRAQKHSTAGSKNVHDSEGEHDQGMLHAAQLERERASRHGKPPADNLSCEAMNDALMLVAHSLHGALTKSEKSLRGGGPPGSVYNQNLGTQPGDHDNAEQQYDHESGKANPSKRTLHKLSNQLEEHQENLKITRTEKTDYVARIRDQVFEPLVREPVRRLQDIAVEAQSYGWSGEQHIKLAGGINHPRAMVKEIHDLGKGLELASSPSLIALEKAIADITQAMNLSLSDADPRELDGIDPYVLTQKSIGDNLIAAEAQAKNAHVAIRAFQT